MSKSETPTAHGIPAAAWKAAALRAWHGFVRHRGLDSAAALTYFALLATLPVALTVVSSFAIGVGKRDAASIILGLAGEVVQQDTVDSLTAPITALFSVTNPGIGLAFGIVLSLWTVSGYATAFGRAVNSAYEVQEGRQLWRFRGTMLVLAVFILAAMSLIVVILFTTQLGFARAILVAPIVAVLYAVLYYVTPNVRHDRLRWVSFGAVFAIVVGGLASAGFALYVTTVSQYDRIYGWLGGAIVLMLWLYIVNFVLVLGAEVDAEVVRLRQLTAGIDATEHIQLPLRDTTRNFMLARQRASDIADARDILNDR